MAAFVLNLKLRESTLLEEDVFTGFQIALEPFSISGLSSAAGMHASQGFMLQVWRGSADLPVNPLS